MTFPPPAANQPALVASLGIGMLASYPAFQAKALTMSLMKLKVINAVLFAFNMYAVQVPGRLDGKGSEDEDGAEEFLNRTLVAPAFWAFGAWGIIFLGEIIFSGAQLTAVSSSVGTLLQEISVPFSMAQVFQILWAASFRPKYKGKWMIVSSAMLPCIAYSLSKAHAIYCSSAWKTYSSLPYCLFLLPITIHFGWTTAASLVNWNGSLARNQNIDIKLVTFAGHLSVIGATALGIFVTLSRRAPVYGGVIAWSLFGIADEMRRRLSQSDKLSSEGLWSSGTKRQTFLSLAGGIISSIVSVVTAFSLHSGPPSAFDISP